MHFSLQHGRRKFSFNIAHFAWFQPFVYFHYIRNPEVLAGPCFSHVEVEVISSSSWREG